MKKLVKLLVALACITITIHVLAQPAPSPAPTPPLSIQTLEHWFAVASAIGSAISVCLTAIAAQLPQFPVIGQIAAWIGNLPVLDFHGLTLGARDARELKAALAAAKAKLDQGAPANPTTTLPAPPPAPKP
jgi:hypothetical protein